MSQILICNMLAAVLVGGPPVATGPRIQPTHALSTAVTVAQIAPDAGQPPRQYGWPLPGAPTVVRAFHPPAYRYGPGHRGVDLAAVTGGPVLAAGDGTVIFAGTVAGRGVVSVHHRGGLRTTYEPVSASVIAGQRVAKGELIGTVQAGHPGCPVPACLHWGVFRASEPGSPNPADPDSGRDYLDPLRLISTMRVRLLPVDDVSHRP